MARDSSYSEVHSFLTSYMGFQATTMVDYILGVSDPVQWHSEVILEYLKLTII